MSSIAIQGVSAQSISQSSTPTPFRDLLSGPKAFYNQPNYMEKTKSDFKQKRVPVTYTWNTECKIIRIAKQIFSIIIFPIGLYKLSHRIAGKFILLASCPMLAGREANYADKSRAQIKLDSDWKYKRITVEVDGHKVDAMIVGKASTLNNGRWVLASNGNNELYEDKLVGKDFKQILSHVKGNGIVFNYPGVGASSGSANRGAMAKAYRAMLNFLEDGKKGIGAKEIIGYGHSIGGGAQADGLNAHSFKKEVKYVFVKSRTFSDLHKTASLLTARPLGFLVKLLGWNMNPARVSRTLDVLMIPEIIMQTANVESYEELKDSSKIIHDGLIPAEASLAKALLDDPTCPKKEKIFIGMPEGHNGGLNDPSFLADRIETCLRR
jgi:Chlamydia CHLPS protein (DUF818)